MVSDFAAAIIMTLVVLAALKGLANLDSSGKKPKKKP
jgi:hypothetical protein